MAMLNIGSIEKILQGETLNPPIVLLLEEAFLLYVDGNGCADNGMVNFRLRLSDSMESFSGFVCKTNKPEQLKPGVLISIEAFNVESLGDNKIVCQISDMSIISDQNNDNARQTDLQSNASTGNVLSQSIVEKKSTLITLADVDLSTGKWNSIRGRVSSKSAVRTYNQDQHKLFYFDIIDESGCLRVKAFDHQCTRIFSSVCIGEMVELSKFYVTVANKNYSPLESDYKIIVQGYTELLVIGNVEPIAFQPSFQFHLLGEMEQLKVNGFYDVIGIIKSVSPLEVVQQRVTLKSLSIVRLLLFDSTGNIEMNLWNDMASNFAGQKNDIVAVKGFRLCLYHNKYNLNNVIGSEVFFKSIMRGGR